MLRRCCFLLLLFTGCSACTEDPTFAEDQLSTDEPATNTPSDAPTDLDQEYQTLLSLVNELRIAGCQCGNTFQPPVAPLSWNNLLAAAASRHSLDMERNNHFDHQGTDGSSFSERITQAGYTWRTVGENIAWNYPDAQSVFAGWKDSPGHCQNMMNANFREMGAARVGSYYTQDFGAQR